MKPDKNLFIPHTQEIKRGPDDQILQSILEENKRLQKIINVLVWVVILLFVGLASQVLNTEIL